MLNAGELEKIIIVPSAEVSRKEDILIYLTHGCFLNNTLFTNYKGYISLKVRQEKYIFLRL